MISSIIFLVIIFTLSLIYILRYFFKIRNKEYWNLLNVHQVDISSIVPAWRRSALKYDPYSFEKRIYDDIKKNNFNFGGTMELMTPVFYATHPDLIKNILVKDFEFFINRHTNNEIGDSGLIYNKMLPSVHNQVWKDLRSTMSPSFSTTKIRQMFPIFTECSANLEKYIIRLLGTKESVEIEVKELFGIYTTSVISSVAFGLENQGLDENGTDTVFFKMLFRLKNQFSGLNILKLGLYYLAPSIFQMLPLSLTDEGATEYFVNIIMRTIEHREKTGERRLDYLQILMDARGEKGFANDEKCDEADFYDNISKIKSTSKKVPLTDELLIAQSLLFFFVGPETTSSLIMLASYELALNPDVQKSLYDELKTLQKSKNGLNFDTIMSLEYLDMVVSETSRKYPGTFRLERIANSDYLIPNTDIKIKKGTKVAIPVIGIHRDPQFFPDPDTFDPLRFFSKVKRERNAYTYMPFGAGPRSCIAMRFAIAESKSALAQLILKFELTPGNNCKNSLLFRYSITGYEPEGGINLVFKPRI